MTPLRQRMIEDMELERKPESTQRAYVRNVAALAKFYGKSPDQLDQEQIRDYLLYLVREKKYADSTYRQVLASKGSVTEPGQHGTEEQRSLAALKILVQSMMHLFDTIEPVQAHEEVYGHRVRELLLLACMETESSWSSVLRANEYNGNRWTTQDYVKLQAPLVLDTFTVSLTRFPGWADFSPFAGWNAGQPTESLPWYDAYNNTKHNREAGFSSAELKHAVSAVGAAVVMHYVQFGTSVIEVTDTIQLSCDAPKRFYVPKMKVVRDGVEFKHDGFHPMNSTPLVV